MKIPLFLALCALGCPLVQPVSAKIVEPQFNRSLWATGRVRSVHQNLVFDLGNEVIRDNTGGSQVLLGFSTEHPRMGQYLEAAKRQGILLRLHGFFGKTGAAILAQRPSFPSVTFQVDKMHLPGEPDR